MKKVVARLALAGALSVAALSAHALTLNLSGYPAGSAFTTLHSAAISGGQESTYAGEFVGSLSGASGFDASTFYTYCVEVTQSFSLPSGNMLDYVIGSGLSQFTGKLSTAATIVDRLGKLFTSLGGVKLPGSAGESAAIQLAVWESIYEGAHSLTVSGDDFYVSGTDAAVTVAANTLLTAAAAVTTSLYSVSVLHSDKQQDFLLVQLIPEPGSLALAALALAGIAASRRRKIG